MEKFIITTHDIQHNLTYKKGNLQSHLYLDNFSTYPSPPKKSCLQTSEIIKNIPQESLQTSKVALERCLTNNERRKPILLHDLINLPYTTIVSLDITFLSFGILKNYAGSGVIVSPRHVLTVRHNVFDEKSGFSLNIIVKPAIYGKFSSYPTANVLKVYTFNITEYENSDTDLALLVLDNDIGYRTGWMGMLAINNDLEIGSLQSNITGYPGDKGYSNM